MATSSQLVERLIRVQEQPPVDLFAAEAGPPDVRPLLVIHGGPDWDHTYLREPLVRLAGHRVLFVDLRGCGRSTKGLGDDAYTPAAATRDLIAVLDALDVEQADVLGFSYGGLIAQRLTLASPSRVRRLVIASSSVLPVPTQKDDAEPRPRSTPWTPEATRRLALDSASRDIWDPERLPGYLDRLNDVRFSAEWARPWQAGTLPSPRLENGLEMLAALHKPVLLLQGRHDATFPIALVEPTLAGVPSASAVVLDDARHMAHVDQPEEWLQAVRDFLTDDADHRG